ncbi:hypothetical protein [Sphingopyxis sp. GW247-27LB]|uniref:hypothetical protein n=1 Tax=Sphingopyxis sp. GW247-27LB TaxID=2012632 RepID=UPI001140B122|nr:hypothetical protein [Sphingopyxis sp. GW247-27LB]
MRRDLHDEMLVPAFYRATAESAWVPVEVRVHTKMNLVGDDMEGYGADGVGVRDITPRVIFMRSQVSVPTRGAIVSISSDEAWQIADSEKPDGITITAMAAPISEAKIAADNYPVRDDG